MFSKYHSQITLEKLSSGKEHQYLERKGRGTSVKKVAQELIGFLNSDGGVLVFGVHDTSGEIEDLKKLTESQLNDYRTIVQDHIAPPASARIELEEITVDSGELIFLYHIEAECERVFQKKDTEEVFRRIADRNKKLNRDEVAALEYDRHIRKFEEELRPDFSLLDLDTRACEAYKEQMKFDGEFSSLALKRALAKRDGDDIMYTNAGILLFAETPAQYIPNASVRYVRYDGTEQKSGKDYNAVKDERFESGIPRLIGDLHKFLRGSFLDYFYLNMETGKFVKIQEFPEEAWLEAIVNAVCHRSYNVQGNEILIRHFDDRLEITNSGPLPAQVTVENIREERFSRNPRIARVLAEMGYVRELNEGVPRIYDVMKDSMLSEPLYEEKSDTITLTLRNNVSTHKETILFDIHKRIEANWEKFNETKRRIISAVILKHEVKVDYIAELLEVSPKTARTNLQSLCDDSILERVSTKQRDKNAFYRFSEH